MKSSRRHLIGTAIWVALIVPTVVWWRDSVLVVLLISIYANIVGHWSAYEAARAKEKNDEQRAADRG